MILTLYVIETFIQERRKMKRNNENHANDIKDYHYHRVTVNEYSGRT